MKKVLLLVLTIGFISTGLRAQDVTIPDANFKAYLVGNTAINTNMDTEIQVSEASAFTGSINCPNQSISDLTGIEAFTAITSLKCGLNQLTSLNVSQNTALVQLECYSNQFTNLDVSQNAALIELTCYENQLTSLNTISNPALTKLICNNTSLTSLDVSQNTSLNYLRCFNNLMLTDLNVANGNNTNFSQFNATNTPNLTCIKVDDAAWSTTNWTNIDAASSFSENCAGAGISESKQTTMTLYPNPTSSQITISTDELVESITIFDMFGSAVQRESETSFSVEGLNTGIYIVNIQTNSGLSRVRFVKK